VAVGRHHAVRVFGRGWRVCSKWTAHHERVWARLARVLKVDGAARACLGAVCVQRRVCDVDTFDAARDVPARPARQCKVGRLPRRAACALYSPATPTHPPPRAAIYNPFNTPGAPRGAGRHAAPRQGRHPGEQTGHRSQVRVWAGRRQGGWLSAWGSWELRSVCQDLMGHHQTAPGTAPAHIDTHTHTAWCTLSWQPLTCPGTLLRGLAVTPATHCPLHSSMTLFRWVSTGQPIRCADVVWCAVLCCAGSVRACAGATELLLPCPPCRSPPMRRHTFQRCAGASRHSGRTTARFLLTTGATVRVTRVAQAQGSPP
jgi:hypothetical protein